MSAGLRLELPAGDGSRVIARRFDAAAPAGVVVIGAALAVPQAFYSDFASWLAEQGFTALTFDYRGIGDAAPRSLRGFRASIDDWIRHDYETVVVEARRLAGGLPLSVVGHSMGAQLVPLLPSAGEVDSMVAVAGGSGHWRGFMPPMWPFMLAMHYGAVPLALPVAGYFPGRRLRMIGDLPAGVMRQWRRWCLHPDYLVGVEPGARQAYARVRFPLLSLSFTDDRMMPERNIDALQSHLHGVQRQSRRLSPADAGGPIGHVGFFRRRYRESLWPVALDWIAARGRGTGACRCC